MPNRSEAQRIGEQGHWLAMSKIATNPNWVARDLGQDYGIDAEAEYAKEGVKGEILKLQFKSSAHVEMQNGNVNFSIGRGLINYAEACRYPVILLRIDVTQQRIWYLWVQQWLLSQSAERGIEASQGEFTVWVPESYSLEFGLDQDLPKIAQWRGETQLILSLLDALRAAAATYNSSLIGVVVEAMSQAAPPVACMSLDVMLREAVMLGDRLRITPEGRVVAQQVFGLVRRFGGRATIQTVDTLVRRNDSYSRTGITGLGFLYDDHFAHTSSLGLVDHFMGLDLAAVAYYCALREAHPEKKDVDFIGGPGDFVFDDLKFGYPEDGSFANKWANRGSSAMLDYLVPTDCVVAQPLNAKK